MNNLKDLPSKIRYDRYRNKVRSRSGGWFPGKGVFCHGHNMMEDLVGKTSYFQVLVLNATGRLVEKRLADWFEAIHICLSWPDPRIWCNCIGALGGAMRSSVVAATTAGILAADSKAYGQKTVIEGADFIQGALALFKKGFPPEEIVQKECARLGGKPTIMGYARPLAKGDERIEAMERTAASLGYQPGEHLRLAYQIEKVLLAEHDESMNINGYISAFISDQGFTPNEAYRIFSVLVASGVTACYVDTYNRPPETFLPLRCDDIDYQGVSSREVPLPPQKNG